MSFLPFQSLQLFNIILFIVGVFRCFSIILLPIDNLVRLTNIYLCTYIWTSFCNFFFSNSISCCFKIFFYSDSKERREEVYNLWQKQIKFKCAFPIPQKINHQFPKCLILNFRWGSPLVWAEAVAWNIWEVIWGAVSLGMLRAGPPLEHFGSASKLPAETKLLWIAAPCPAPRFLHRGSLASMKRACRHEKCFPPGKMFASVKSVCLHEKCFPPRNVFASMKRACRHEKCLPPWKVFAAMKSVCLHETCLPPWKVLAAMKSVCRHETCLPPWKVLAAMKSVCRHEKCLPPWEVFASVKGACLHEKCFPPGKMFASVKSVCLHETCLPPWKVLASMKNVCLSEKCLPPWKVLASMKSVCL